MLGEIIPCCEVKLPRVHCKQATELGVGSSRVPASHCAYDTRSESWLDSPLLCAKFEVRGDFDGSEDHTMNTATFSLPPSGMMHVSCKKFCQTQAPQSDAPCCGVWSHRAARRCRDCHQQGQWHLRGRHKSAFRWLTATDSRTTSTEVCAFDLNHGASSTRTFFHLRVATRP